MTDELQHILHEMDVMRGRLFDLTRDIRVTEEEIASRQGYLKLLQDSSAKTNETLKSLAARRDKLMGR